MKLKDKVAVVTGAGRGLGRAVALTMSQEGANVTIMSRSRNELEKAGEIIRAGGGRVLIFMGDVSRRDDVAHMVDQTMTKFTRIDILVNNAAIIGPARFVDDADPDIWEKTIAINLHGAYYCAHAITPIMLRQHGGKIISIGSGLGAMAYPRFCAYSVSKAGIIQFTRSLSEELKDINIQVNAIDPGVMDTAMQGDVRSLGPERLGQDIYNLFMENKEKGLLKDPTIVADLTVFLASCESDHLTGHYGTLREYRRLGWKG